ncbi:M48 family metallopeptidase, partial [Campylobacter jejuni]|nr:M48 family metallopeptidase [Campylobacter jejuni]
HNKAYINLNLKLIQKSLRAIEYVILHEICHLKFPNHSKEFYDFIEYFMSDFRQREKEFLS